MNSQNPKIHFLLFYKSKLRRTSLHKSIILAVSKNQRCLKKSQKACYPYKKWSQLCQAIFYNKILEILSYYSRFPHLSNKWTTQTFTESVHRYILCTHSFLQQQANKHNLMVDFVFLLIFAIQPNTHAELKQRKTTVEIRKFIFKHVFNAISKFQPDKTRPNMWCISGMENKQNLQKNGAYLCQKCQTRYLLIIKEQALTGGE
ncbi:Hypothetical_protein [Hexamita inflata]|uniref:Hypothetical_protein n=1 Tax=Hexamita inflata TaxID=28002 RepID=A0AA86R4A5_9EUKA|nr:Hypothetical protein HINF_LOCUS56278 [Hexamita inflata]